MALQPPRGREPQPSIRVPDLFLSGERLSPSPWLPSTRRWVVGPVTPPPAVRCSAPGVPSSSSRVLSVLGPPRLGHHRTPSSAQVGRLPNPASLQNIHRHPGFGGEPGAISTYGELGFLEEALWSGFSWYICSHLLTSENQEQPRRFFLVEGLAGTYRKRETGKGRRQPQKCWESSGHAITNCWTWRLQA